MSGKRELVAGLYREVARRGLIAGSSGNVSARSGKGMMITPTGAHGDQIDAGHVVPVTLDGAWTGRRLPSSEWRMHAEIYRAYPRATVIVHTHSDAATALACLGRPLPAFHYDIAQFGGDDVKVAPYALFGSAELARHAVTALQGRTACLLANHGAICYAADEDAALLAAVRLEMMARQYLLALAAGGPTILDADAMVDVRARYASYGQRGGKT
jgi:L-fuculose-phosphate aldolase